LAGVSCHGAQRNGDAKGERVAKALEKVGSALKAASGLAVLVGLKFHFGDDSQDRKLQEVTIFGLPLFDRKRMEARRARKAAKKATVIK